MDDTRYRELVAKRDDVGLSDQEADELGRMMAERDGQPYANADDRPDVEPSHAGGGGNAPIRRDGEATGEDTEAGPTH